MKQDAESDRGGRPERDELRALLGHWTAPAPPPEIEDALRREFRRRRSRRWRALWVPLAAAATLIVAWQMRSTDVPLPPPSPESPLAALPSPGAPPRTALPESVSGPTPAVAEAGRTPRRPIPAPKEPEVVVEPDQAALLVELGRKLSGTRQAIPGTAIPQMPEVEVPRYLEEWQTVAGEWPLVLESEAIGGR
jgi:hypothetical protein